MVVVADENIVGVGGQQVGFAVAETNTHLELLSMVVVVEDILGYTEAETVC